jgi:hypothetical protein
MIANSIPHLYQLHLEMLHFYGFSLCSNPRSIHHGPGVVDLRLAQLVTSRGGQILIFLAARQTPDES